jgi:hypothetical protein
LFSRIAALEAGLAAGAEVVHIAGTQEADELPVRLTTDGYKRFSVSHEGNSVRLATLR